MMRSLSVFVSVLLLFVLAMAQEIGLKVEGGGSASTEARDEAGDADCRSIDGTGTTDRERQ